jgi:hypothetical protein
MVDETFHYLIANLLLKLRDRCGASPLIPCWLYKKTANLYASFQSVACTRMCWETDLKFARKTTPSKLLVLNLCNVWGFRGGDYSDVTPSDENSSLRCLEQAVSSETSMHLYQTLRRHFSEYHVFLFILVMKVIGARDWSNGWYCKENL